MRLSETRTHFHGLSGERIDRAGRTHLELVKHHVSETLVVHHPDVDIRRELLASDPRIHRLVSVIVIPRCQELLAEVVYGGVFFRKSVQKQLAHRRRGFFDTDLKGVAS